jgi:Carboxypeptidase regulatory-like domain
VYSSFESHSVFQRQTDATGKFEMPKPLRPGRYSIDVRPETIPDGCHLQAVVLGGHEIAPEDFEIIGSAPLEIVLARNAGKITGSAVDEDGKPLLNATVTLYSAGGSSPPRKQAAADDGSFAFPALRPGRYVLLAWEELNDDFWEDPEYRKKYESRAIEITVGSSETESAQVKAIPAADMK